MKWLIFIMIVQVMDLCYGLDGSKLFNMGFKLPLNFEEYLRKIVEWTLENQKWLEE